MHQPSIPDWSQASVHRYIFKFQWFRFSAAIQQVCRLSQQQGFVLDAAVVQQGFVSGTRKQLS
eukprot:874777-Amphidinium_carterae.1